MQTEIPIQALQIIFLAILTFSVGFVTILCIILDQMRQTRDEILQALKDHQHPDHETRVSHSDPTI